MRLLTEQELIDQLANCGTICIGIHAWVSVLHNGIYVPDPIGQRGVNLVARLAQQLDGKMLVFVPGGQPYLSDGINLAVVYAQALKTAIKDHALLFPQSNEPLAVSTAGEIHYFRECQEKFGIESIVLVCASSHLEQVQIIAEKNLSGEVSLVAYDAPIQSPLYLFPTRILLKIDPSGKLMELVARKLGPLKSTMSHFAHG